MTEKIAKESLTSQLAASLDFMSPESEEKKGTGRGGANETVDQKSSARQLLEAKRAQRQSLDAMNSLFVPFVSDSKSLSVSSSSSSRLNGVNSNVGMYGQIAESTVEAPTYWKTKGSKKQNEKKKSSGSNYKERFSAKMSKNKGRQRRLNGLKNIY